MLSSNNQTHKPCVQAAALIPCGLKSKGGPFGGWLYASSDTELVANQLADADVVEVDVDIGSIPIPLANRTSPELRSRCFTGLRRPNRLIAGGRVD